VYRHHLGREQGLDGVARPYALYQRQVGVECALADLTLFLGQNGQAVRMAEVIRLSSTPKELVISAQPVGGSGRKRPKAETGLQYRKIVFRSA
jgi:hypothetical protein